jgi:predicted CXXCH cytochrome family protein
MNAAARIMLMITALAAQPLSLAPGTRQIARAAAVREHPAVSGDGGAACTTCHTEVTSARVVHGPVAVGQCSACHVVDTGAGVRRIALKGGGSDRDTTALCVACHDDVAERLKLPHRHAPVASGSCTACHDPHGSPFRFQLPADGDGACVRCHQDIAEALAQPHVHPPAATSCRICHDSHAGPQPSQLRARSNAVCGGCHVTAPADRSDAEAAALFGRHAADIVERLAADGSRILLDASLASGHPTRGHPVDRRQDPSRTGRPLDCASCHNPHGSAGAKLLRFGATGVSSLCIRCHGK